MILDLTSYFFYGHFGFDILLSEPADMFIVTSIEKGDSACDIHLQSDYIWLVQVIYKALNSLVLACGIILMDEKGKT